MQDSAATHKHYWVLLETMNKEEDYFLERWSLRMGQAGYLQHTTAKRLDCLQALSDFISPMLAHWKNGIVNPDFPWLIRHEEEWGQPQIVSARRHRMRGITADLYIGCFKTFIQSLVDVIEKMEGSYEAKVLARRHIKLYGDALEVLFVQDWTQTLPEVTAQQLDEANRLLTLEKCRFENILNSTSDLIFVIGNNGHITNVNNAVKSIFPDQDLIGVPVWDFLTMEARSMDDLLKYYQVGVSCEMNPLDNDAVYRMQINPVSNVSLASDEYMIMLTNITAHATQRETLERVVAQRTEDLRQEKEHLEEMNITLRNVLRSIENERESMFREVSAKIETIVLPALERIESEDDPAIRSGYITVVKDQLARLAPGSHSFNPQILKLTSTETKVSQFIQAGYSTKDIAVSLNLSIETIQTHRKNIRRKLGLRGKSIGLYEHLKQIGQAGSSA